MQHASAVTHMYLQPMYIVVNDLYCSGCLIYEWDIATGIFTRSLTGHSRPLTCIGVSRLNHDVILMDTVF